MYFYDIINLQKNNIKENTSMASLLYQTKKIISREKFEKINFFFPAPKNTGRPPLSNFLVLNAILWVARMSIPWRAMPEKFGNWNSIYKIFRRWIKLGVFQNLLQHNKNLATNSLLIMIDSTHIIVHQDATGARKDAVGNENNQAIGKTAGGNTTKIHALVNEHMQIIAYVLTEGQIFDSKEAINLLQNIDIKDKKILADKAYHSNEIRTYIKENNAIACIPNKSNTKIKEEFDKLLYKMRNIIERTFQRLKMFRRIGTRYDKLAICFSAFITLVAFIMLEN